MIVDDGVKRRAESRERRSTKIAVDRNRETKRLLITRFKALSTANFLRLRAFHRPYTRTHATLLGRSTVLQARCRAFVINSALATRLSLTVAVQPVLVAVSTSSVSRHVCS